MRAVYFSYMVSSDVFAAAFGPLFTARTYLFVFDLAIFLFFLSRMNKRRFYFVRHGETILNAAGVRQGEDGGLSERGKQQADATGKFLKQYRIKRIIASPYERTKETAAIINAHLKVPIRYSRLFVERRNPSEIIGHHSDEPQVADILAHMDGVYHDDNYRYSDEENFQDMKDRARKALAYLTNQHTSHTCVVTHGIYLKLLIAFLLYRDNLHASDYAKLSFFNAADNAGVTICEYDPWEFFSPTRGWKVVAYNEKPKEGWVASSSATPT